MFERNQFSGNEFIKENGTHKFVAHKLLIIYHLLDFLLTLFRFQC